MSPEKDGQWRAGLHLHQKSLAVHIPGPLFKPGSHFRTPVTRLKEFTGLFAPLLNVAIMNNSPFYTFFCNLTL